MRTALLACGLAGVGLFAVGCDSASSTNRTAEQKGRDAGAAVGKAADQAAGAAGRAADKVGDAAGKAADKAGDALSKAGDKVTGAADAAGDAARENVVKPIEEMYPQVEEKIKGLSGAAATTAKEKFEVVKRLAGEFRKASADGLTSAKEKLLAAVEELKKAVGL